MGASITAVNRFAFHSGEAADNYNGVGFSYDDRPIQYPDHWGINLRVTVRTDGLGGSRVTVAGLARQSARGGRLRLFVDQNAASHCRGGYSGGLALNADGSGALDVKLSPNTTYYIWIVNNNSAPFYSDYYLTAGLSVAVTGSYGAPATPSAADGSFGETLPITLTGGSTGARYTVKTSCAGAEETLQTLGAATALRWTPSLEAYAARLPNAAGAQATVTVDTWYDGTKVGTRSCTLTLRFAPGSLAPELAAGWALAAPRNEGAAQGFTVYIQGYSKARVSFDSSKVSCLYGAGIASFSLSCRGETVSAAPYDTPVLPDTAEELVCTVTDTRGQTSGETLRLTLCPYARPALSSLRVFRADAQGEADEDGSFIRCEAQRSFSALGGENSCTLRAAVRAPGGSFGPGESLTPGVPALLGPCSPDVSYEVRIAATDALGNTTEALRRLSTRRWAMRFRADGRGVAFGKAPEVPNALELANGWSLVLRDAQGSPAVLDHAALTSLLELIEN